LAPAPAYSLLEGTALGVRDAEKVFHLSHGKLIAKPPDKVSKWKLLCERAVRNKGAVYCDFVVTDCSKHELLAVRQWWLKHIPNEGKLPAIANKDFQHLGTIFWTVSKVHSILISTSFDGLRLTWGQLNSSLDALRWTAQLEFSALR
jgi:hypothetical protein